MADLEITTVPRDLYYHEVAYVRGLEARIQELEAELRAERFRTQALEEKIEKMREKADG